MIARRWNGLDRRGALITQARKPGGRDWTRTVLPSMKPDQGPLQRWTWRWAVRLARRLCDDAEFRIRAGRRLAALLKTGRLATDQAVTRRGDAQRLLAAAAAALPADLAPLARPVEPFDAWLEANRWTEGDKLRLVQRLDAQRDAGGALPRISVLTPVWNTLGVHLEALVDSLNAQVFEDWELCLVDDASRAPHLAPLLERLARDEPRIRLGRLSVNGGIARATNAAAELASGEIFAFVDHDDLLTPDCLGELALAFASNATLDLAYSDHDKIDDDGRRRDPAFKPGWSRVHLFSHMYLGHVMAVRRPLFFETGGLRSAFDGAQDYDFTLRAAPRARRVGHIPRILYHWRAAEGSTATSGDAKPGSIEAGRKAAAEAARLLPGAPRISHPGWARAIDAGFYALEPGPDFSATVATVTLYARPDSASHANLAAKTCEADYLFFFHEGSTPPDPADVQRLAAVAAAFDAAAAGCSVIDAQRRISSSGLALAPQDGRLLPLFAGLELGDPGPGGALKTPRPCSVLSGDGLLVRKDAFDWGGGFDEAVFPDAGFAEDLALRLSGADKAVIVVPDVAVRCMTPPASLPRRSLARLRARHGARSDPFYNPNLTGAVPKPDARRFPVTPPPSRPVRMAVFTHNLNYEGAPITLLDLVRALKREFGYAVTVLSPVEGPLRADFETSGIPVEIIPPQPVEGDRETTRTALKALARRLEGLRAEMVLANTLQSWHGVMAAHEAGLGAVWWQHESEPFDRYFDYLAPAVRPFAYAAFGAARRVVQVAEATRQIWLPIETRGNFEVIAHAAPPERREAELARWTRGSAREQLKARPDEVMVLITGSVCARKGQEDLVAALGALPERDAARMRLLIVGPIAERAYLARLELALAQLPPLRAARCVITGVVPETSLYYRAADIFVCASRLESAPRVLHEAMAFGLPIVTTPVDGIPEMVEDGISALFYPPGDAAALAERLGRLAREPRLRRTVGEAGSAALAEAPDFGTMLRAFERLVRESQAPPPV